MIFSPSRASSLLPLPVYLASKSRSFMRLEISVICRIGLVMRLAMMVAAMTPTSAAQSPA